MVGIKYVGLKEAHTDTKFGTKLEWKPGEVHNVGDEIAKKMLVHTDTYAEAKPVKNEPEAVAAKDDATTPTKQPVPLPHLEGMGKNELIAFAQQHYGEPLHHRMSEENMRGRILSLIHSRGRG